MLTAKDKVVLITGAGTGMDEAADCMFFLSFASYCNGAVLVVDGGSSA